VLRCLRSDAYGAACPGALRAPLLGSARRLAPAISSFAGRQVHVRARFSANRSLPCMRPATTDPHPLLVLTPLLGGPLLPHPVASLAGPRILRAPDSVRGDRFGRSVALSPSIALVGADSSPCSEPQVPVDFLSLAPSFLLSLSHLLPSSGPPCSVSLPLHPLCPTSTPAPFFPDLPPFPARSARWGVWRQAPRARRCLRL